MNRRYILAPQAARDLVDIRRYLRKESSEETAARVESVIRERFTYLADFPGGGHVRSDLTNVPVRFFSVYSYLIVYLETGHGWALQNRPTEQIQNNIT